MQEEKKEREGDVCRFCHTEEVDVKALIIPCQCKGSMRYVHPICLDEWRATSIGARDRCALCGMSYQYSRYDYAFYSHIISGTLFGVWLYAIDYKRLLFEKELDGDLVTVTLVISLYLLFVVATLMHSIWPEKYEASLFPCYIDIDSMDRVHTIQLFVAMCTQPWYKIGFMTGLAMGYHLFSRFVVWVIGMPRIHMVT